MEVQVVEEGQGGEAREVVFKYDKVGPFCYLCGMLGHVDDFCPMLLYMNGDDGTKGWGPELRADPRSNSGAGGWRWLREDKVTVTDSMSGELRSINGGSLIGNSLGHETDKSLNVKASNSQPSVLVHENQVDPRLLKNNYGDQIMKEMNDDECEIIDGGKKRRRSGNKPTFSGATKGSLFPPLFSSLVKRPPPKPPPRDRRLILLGTDGPSKPRSSCWEHSMAEPPLPVLVPSRPPPKPPDEARRLNDMLLNIGFILCDEGECFFKVKSYSYSPRLHYSEREILSLMYARQRAIKIVSIDIIFTVNSMNVMASSKNNQEKLS